MKLEYMYTVVDVELSMAELVYKGVLSSQLFEELVEAVENNDYNHLMSIMMKVTQTVAFAITTEQDCRGAVIRGFDDNGILVYALLILAKKTAVAIVSNYRVNETHLVIANNPSDNNTLLFFAHLIKETVNAKRLEIYGYREKRWLTLEELEAKALSCSNQYDEDVNRILNWVMSGAAGF